MDGGRRGRRKVVPAAGRHHGATPARFLHRSRIVPSRAGPMAPAKGHGNRMSQQTTIRKLAALVNTPVDKLLEQLAEAGMKFDDPDQVVTSTEKVKLLGFLRRTHGKAGKASEDAVAPKKITLSRRRKQELTVGGGKNRSTVDVVVRKKVTLVKPGEADADATAEQAAASGDDERAELLRTLEESRLRNLTEQPRLPEEDKRRVAAAAEQSGREAWRERACQEMKI